MRYDKFIHSFIYVPMYLVLSDEKKSLDSTSFSQEFKTFMILLSEFSLPEVRNAGLFLNQCHYCSASSCFVYHAVVLFVLCNLLGNLGS